MVFTISLKTLEVRSCRASAIDLCPGVSATRYASIFGIRVCVRGFLVVFSFIAGIIIIIIVVVIMLVSLLASRKTEAVV